MLKTKAAEVENEVAYQRFEIVQFEEGGDWSVLGNDGDDEELVYALLQFLTQWQDSQT